MSKLISNLYFNGKITHVTTSEIFLIDTNLQQLDYAELLWKNISFNESLQECFSRSIKELLFLMQNDTIQLPQNSVVLQFAFSSRYGASNNYN